MALKVPLVDHLAGEAPNNSATFLPVTENSVTNIILVCIFLMLHLFSVFEVKNENISTLTAIF